MKHGITKKKGRNKEIKKENKIKKKKNGMEEIKGKHLCGTWKISNLYGLPQGHVHCLYF